ncbi:MAG: SigE family RNA polymerase sigma factor [Micromonosporaceae bacterium]
MDGSASFEGFVNTRSQALLRYAYVLTGDPHDAADLLQEGLVRLRGAWTRVKKRDDPEGYVRQIMARHHISVWRRRRRERLVGEMPERAYTEPGFDRAEDSGLWQSLATLPRRQRAILVLRYYEGLADEQIAVRLGISRGTVRSQASRALGKLRSGWRHSGDTHQPQSRGRSDVKTA